MIIGSLKLAYFSPLKEREPTKIVPYFGFIPLSIPLYLGSVRRNQKNPGRITPCPDYSPALIAARYCMNGYLNA